MNLKHYKPKIAMCAYKWPEVGCAGKATSRSAAQRSLRHLPDGGGGGQPGYIFPDPRPNRPIAMLLGVIHPPSPIPDDEKKAEISLDYVFSAISIDNRPRKRYVLVIMNRNQDRS